MTIDAPDQARRLRPPWDDRRGGRSVVVLWTTTRALMFATLLIPPVRQIFGDVFYYWRKINAMWGVGLSNTLNEYPTPVVWFLTVPYAAGIGTRSGYLAAFLVVMLALDAAFTALLFRGAGRHRDTAVDFWLIFVFLVGPLSYFRFDLVPAVLAGAALLFARTRPGLTGALAGVGAALKLWPALLYGAFVAPRGRRRVLGWAFWSVGIGLAVISVVAGGFRRLISPLTWQSDRGLQIESLWSTPLMVLRAAAPSRWTVEISRYQAYEIFGPGVDTFLTAATFATVVGLAMIALLFVRSYRVLDPSPRAVGLVVLAVIVIMIITNKTLSPQYLLWLGGPMASLLLIDRRRARTGFEPDRESSTIDGLARQLLFLALLTQLVYPLLYPGLLGRHGSPGLVLSTAVTVLRNLALVVFTVAVFRGAWVALGRLRRRPEPALASL